MKDLRQIANCRCIFIIAAFVGLSSCKPPEITEVTPSPSRIATRTVGISPSPDKKKAYLPTYEAKMTLWATEATATQYRKPARTPVPTDTPRPSPTYMPALPRTTSVQMATPFSIAQQAISLNNFRNLREVARWGRGSIIKVAFSPSGRSFIVGSNYGLAEYDKQNLAAPPLWHPFPSPFYYQGVHFSADGQLVLLSDESGDRVFDLQAERFSEAPTDTEWKIFKDTAEWDSLSVISGDGELEFRGARHYGYDEERFSEEYTVREVFYTGSGEKLYDLRDDPHYITISDRANPEGCDVHFFSPCGNAYLSVISTPFKASFSNSGVTFTVLYRPRSLYYPNIYGTLRVYRTSDGKLLKIIGSLAHPVQDFSYAPNAEELLIGFVDGSIMLWDIHADEINYSSWHFHEEGAFLSFSADGDFLVIQRRHVVEIRSSDDGTMRSRIPASAVSLSPDGRMMAVGTEEGLIRILDIASGSTLLNIDAHDDIVYSIAFSPDGLYLASSGQDCKLRTWSVVSGEYLHPLETISVNPDDIWGLGSRILIHYLRFVPDTNGIIGFGSWGTVVNWNVDSGAKKYIVESAPLEYYQGMMTVKPYFPEFFSLDLVEQRFQINRLSYNLQDGAYIGEYEPPENLPEYCGYPGPRSLTGNLIFTKGYEYLEGQICIMDSASYQLLGKIEVVQKEDTYFDSIDWLYLSPNGDQLYVSTYGGMVHVYQIALMEQ